MRLVLAIAMVAAMGGAEMERAQQVARSRDAERAEFHHRYVFALPGDVVTELEVITEFRRLVLITEEHLRLGDQMFSRGLRAAETAMAPTRGVLTLKSKLRFHPLNTYADIPAFKLAMGPASDAARVGTAPLAALDTQVTGEYSLPYKDHGGKRVRTLMGATLQTNLPTSSVGQSLRPLGVVLDGMDVARTPVDFARLD